MTTDIRIPLTRPFVPAEARDQLLAVLESGYLTEGPVTRKLEEAVRRITGARHALAVCNCTLGLEMALRAMEIGAGDEVVVPDYTYPATAHVVRMVGARLVIVDVDPRTMLMDFRALEDALTEQTRAVIPVSLFGNPLDYDRLNRIREQHDLRVLEDAACALGAERNGTRVGSLADISVFSLHPRKVVTTGEGGLVTTNDPRWAEWMESFKHFGLRGTASGPQAAFDQIGTNLKMSDLQAAVGLAQMRQLDAILVQRAALAERYRQLLADLGGVDLPEVTPGGRHSWQSFCVFVDNRDAVLQRLRKQGIEAQIGTYALHRQRAFRPGPDVILHGDLPGSRYAFEHCLCLPLYHQMTTEEQEIVVDELGKAVGA